MMTPIPFFELRQIFERNPAQLINRLPGIYLVDKTAGPTSHDVIDDARLMLGLQRVGHSGTLDPMATGLLLILAGNATRLFDAMQVYTKCYQATLKLGIRTDSQDITGEVIEERAVPVLTVEDIETALASFRGDIFQIPPMLSSIKKRGIPLWRFARKGKVVKRVPRKVRVDKLTLTDWDAVAGEIQFEMTVSKGFYVRTLIDDLGEALGCGATMTALRRTAIGPFRLEDATSVTALIPGATPEWTLGDDAKVGVPTLGE